MKIYTLGIFLAFAAMLSGCMSEVDKCVGANVKSNELNSPNQSEKERVNFEAKARLVCLQATGKNN
jgi:hypothetical protein